LERANSLEEQVRHSKGRGIGESLMGMGRGTEGKDVHGEELGARTKEVNGKSVFSQGTHRERGDSPQRRKIGIGKGKMALNLTPREKANEPE